MPPAIGRRLTPLLLHRRGGAAILPRLLCSSSSPTTGPPPGGDEPEAPSPASRLSVDLSGLYNQAGHEHEHPEESDLVRHLKGIIKFRGGPISVAVYMAEVLTNPKSGFCINEDVFGEKDDRCLEHMPLGTNGAAGKVNLVELGPDRGTLMADLLHCRDEVVDEKVELERTYSSLTGGNVTWHASLEEPTPAALLYLKKCCKWARTEELDKLNHIKVCPGPLDLTRAIAKRISADGGGALIIDYGTDGIISDSLQAIRKHKFLNILDNPGIADLSAYVDFDSIRHSAEGVSDNVPITQSQFLGCLGINFHMEALLQNCTDEQAESLRNGYWQLVGDGEAPFLERPDGQTPIGMGSRYLAMAVVNKLQGVPVPFQ